MAATVSVPLVLRQCVNADLTHQLPRRWKRERTSRRSSRTKKDESTWPPGRTQSDPSLVDAALEEWGLPSSNKNKAPIPTCATSWEERSIEASCSYLQQISSDQAKDVCSLDQWDSSITYSPFSISSLNSHSAQNMVSAEPTPISRRVLVIGRNDGTVLLLRARGRAEDQVEVIDESPDLSLTLASASPTRSSSTMSLSSHLRSPDAEPHSINLSSAKRVAPAQLSPLFPHDRSFPSAVSRSTTSLPSTQSLSGAAVNVQVEESLPATSVETNITVTGLSVKSGSSKNDAEHILEAQIAAADRNDHQHGLVGDVIEKLGFSHHHTRHAAPYEAEALPVSPSALLHPRSTLGRASTPFLNEPEPCQPEILATLSSLPSPDECSSADGHFEPIYTIMNADRSPVVAVRILPVPSTSHGSPKASLLIVQEEGRVSLWSTYDSRLIWETNVAKFSLNEVSGSKQESFASSSTSPNSESLLTRPQTPLSRVAASSLKPKSSKAELNKVSPRPPAGSRTVRVSEVVGVTLSGEVRCFRHNHKDCVALWDTLADTSLFVDLSDGTLMAKETISDVDVSCVPDIVAGEVPGENLFLRWLDSTHKVRTRPLKYISLTMSKNGSVASHEAGASSCVPVSAFSDALPENLAADHIAFAETKLLAIDRCNLRIFDLTNGTEMTSVPDVDSIIGASPDLEQVHLKTKTGISCVSLSGTDTVVHHVMDAKTTAKMYLCWAKPDGQLLNKYFALQTSNDCDEDARETQFISIDINARHVEQLEAPTERHSARPNSNEKVTAVLPMSLERVAIAVRGGLRIVSLTTLSTEPLAPIPNPMQNSIGAEKEISLLRLAVAPRSGTRYILGATRQGDVAMWDANDLQLIPSTSRSISTSPVEALIVFGDEDNTIRLHGCVACVSADSSVTMILLETLKTQYIIPGRAARLESLATRADEILLIYDDGKARVWDLRTQELRRSIAIDQAQALLDDGKGWWGVKHIQPYSPSHSGTTGVLSRLAAAQDTFSGAMLVDFRRAIEAASRAVDSAHTAKGDADKHQHDPEGVQYPDEEDEAVSGPPAATLSLASPAARKAITIVRPLLSVVFPLGLDAHLDNKLKVLLDLQGSGKALSRGAALSLGLFQPADSVVFPTEIMQEARASWTWHSHVNTARTLICCVLLRILEKVKELHSLALELTYFIETQLHRAVGPAFAELSLTQLACSLFDSNDEMQRSSRALFKSTLSRSNEAHVESLCETWQPHLPHVQSATKVFSADAVNALALLGTLAVERFKWMSPKLLKDVALSISLIISTANSKNEDGASSSDRPRQAATAMAIDLCRAGFSIWQHYFDATEIVRSLFGLSTTGNANGSVDGSQRALARKATLQIAQDNTPLFMTTLSLDILHARSAAHCAATMRLVAFMVRKRPLILLPNLPRLAEAVVKSLDPTVTEMREAVVNAATVMISELVSTYPTIAFFGRGQRLAVGTHEGAVIMYDLKTATRLYVIEGHRQPLNGCSFSPDGRRLITVSLAEQKLLVWKVGSGFTSFFTPGTIPRQGGTDSSGAYRSFDFNVGDADHKEASALDQNILKAVQFEWHNSQRSVRVILGPAQLNISVD